MKKMDADVAKSIEEINKKYGAATVMRMGDAPIPVTDVISTGCLTLDLALGCRGFPRGRIVEIYGPESSGKTTLALHAIANAQAAGGICAVVDAEHALDLTYAKNLGVDVPHLLLSQPDWGEQALEVVESLVDSGKVHVVLIDSVAALTPKAELDGDFGRAGMGEHARLMSQAMRKLTATAHRTNTLLIFINQLRHKIGVMFGSPETTTGGNALKFYASVRLDVRKRDAVKEARKGDDPEQIGNVTEVKVVKNKMAPPFKVARFEIHYGKGVDKLGDLMTVALEAGVLDKSGNWFSYKGERLGNGWYNAVATLADSPIMVDAIRKDTLVKVGP